LRLRTANNIAKSFDMMKAVFIEAIDSRQTV
jgi:hypothetical protein